jgi:hypothetical protein
MTPEPNTTGTLSRRDYFAAMAMQGFCSAMYVPSTEVVAAYAIAYADTLIAELDKHSSPPNP